MAEADEEIQPSRASAARLDNAALAVLGSASRGKADAFLERQTELSELQKENLRLENWKLQAEHAFELSHIRFRRFSDYAKFSLEIAGFLVVLLIVCGLATMVWSATQDRDLVVDAFSVPPDVAQSGMTGGVLAGRVLDTFGRMQASIGVSVIQGANSYHAGSSEEVRVEIPETGISIGELNRYLRGWLGHETHVNGDLVRTTKGYALTTRAGGQPGVTIDDTNINVLVEKAAEHVFAVVRPLRYLDWLEANKRMADALVAVAPLTKVGDAHDRAVAYAAWAGLLKDSYNLEAALPKARTAVALDPQNPTAVGWLASVEWYLGHDEAAWRLASRNAGLWRGAEVADLDPSLVAAAPLFFKARSDGLVGDWTAVLKAENGFDANGENYSETLTRAEEGAEDHDAALARSFARAIPLKSDGGAPNPQFDEGRMVIALMQEDWNTAVLAGRRAESHFLADPKGMSSLRLVLWRKLAYALARTGRFAEADSMIAKTPSDCDPCMRARGTIAGAEGNWIAAARDFSIVASRSPDIPFADADWGVMLLRKGDYDGAIAKFREANRKGPHFADPLEMWGEALMQENRSDLALAKFEEANKYAPNWGRLHLEWGKALFYVGRKQDARREFQTAAGFDLSTADGAALARMGAIQ
jgi:tetratricopeptide (TPR) repeat protein